MFIVSIEKIKHSQISITAVADQWPVVQQNSKNSIMEKNLFFSKKKFSEFVSTVSLPAVGGDSNQISSKTGKKCRSNRNFFEQVKYFFSGWNSKQFEIVKIVSN